MSEQAATHPIAQAEERLSEARKALAAGQLDAAVEHLQRAEEIVRYARYVVEAQR